MFPKLTREYFRRAGLWLVLLAIAPPVAATPEEESRQVWDTSLKPVYFADRAIIERAPQTIIELTAPPKAEDPALVPISIHTKIPQTDDAFIQKIYVFIDKNPLPLVGIFAFTPASGRADLAMRIRIDDRSYVRAIAEMNTGELYMDERFVRAVGGCSAPPGKDLAESMARLGKIKIRILGEIQQGEPSLTQLMISHPNITGLTMDQVRRMKPLPYFVKEINVSFDDQPVLSAETTFAISQDPSFRFFFVPHQDGELTVEVIDTKEERFTSSYSVRL
jgi:sulfur-oxidizing protein SoxY